MCTKRTLAGLPGHGLGVREVSGSKPGVATTLFCTLFCIRLVFVQDARFMSPTHAPPSDTEAEGRDASASERL